MSQRAALVAAFLVMESLAFFVIGAVLGGATGHEGLVYPAFLAAEAGGFLVVKGLHRVDLPHRILVVAGGLISFVALVSIAGLAIDPGSFPPGWAGVFGFLSDPGQATQQTNGAQAYGMLLLVVAWSRGMMVAQRRLEREQALRSLSIGVIVLLCGLLFGQESSAKGAVDGASIPLVGAGLLTLTLIHLRDARPSGSTVRGPWVAISAGTVVALMLAGATLGVLPLGPMGFVYDHGVSPVLNLMLFLVTWALIIVTYPFAWLIGLVIDALGGRQRPQQDQQQGQSGQNTSVVQHGHPAAIFVVLGKAVVIVAVAAVIVYLAYRLFRRLQRPMTENEDREALQRDGSLRDDLLSLFRGLRPRRPTAPGLPPEPRLPAGILEVRRLYLRMLSVAAERGRVRSPVETPNEFLVQSEQVISAPAAEHVTRAFVRARYGLKEPPASDLERLREELRAAERSRSGGS